MQHEFLFQEGLWIGEGKITFSISPDHIRFYTRWTNAPDKEGRLKWVQEVEMQGGEEKVSNHFTVTKLNEGAFSISLENEIIGKAMGKGVLDDKKIAWEIKSVDTFHGFEVYELQENGDYMFHAEYVAQDNFRTLIDGRIWKKISLNILLILSICAFFLFGAGAVGSKGPLDLPSIPWPKDNSYTEKKAELGRLLFFDKRLSSDGTIACASCHSTAFGFADPDPVSKGVQGRLGVRNAPTVINTAFLKYLFWDGRADSLEAQCLGPICNPLEMTLDDNPHQSYLDCAQRICQIEGYRALFKETFGEECTMDNITKAIATFERTILSSNSRYDQYLAGNKTALTQEELHGWEVFNKSRCASCHGGPLFSDGKFYNIGVGMDQNERDLGRYRITNDKKDWGSFKVPTLRDISKTALYMHDGSLKTLEEVIDYYDKGCTPNDNLSYLIHPLNLTGKDKKALVSFLKTLDGTGWEHVKEPTSFPK